MENKTKVTVRFTEIKMYNQSTDSVDTVRVNGKLNVSQCKEYAKNSNSLYIDKTDSKESFLVDTTQLILLREDN